MAKKPSKPSALLARPIYDAHPAPPQIPRPGPKVTVDEFLAEAEKSGDSLFIFIIRHACSLKGDAFQFHNDMESMAAELTALSDEYDYQSQD